MAYATLSDIQYEFKDVTFSSSTAITPARITTFLAAANVEIDSRLSVKYSVPITGTNSLVLMKQIATWLVRDRLEAILYVKTGEPKPDQAPASGNWRKKAIDILDALVKGTMKLTDQDHATAADGVRSYSVDNSKTPVFDRDSTQW